MTEVTLRVGTARRPGGSRAFSRAAAIAMPAPALSLTYEPSDD